MSKNPEPVNEAADSPIVRAVEHAVQKALQGPKRLTRVLTSVVIALVLLVAGLGYVAWQAHSTATQLRDSSVASCESGNATRADEVAIWDSFIGLLLQGNTSAKAHSEATAFEALVAKTYEPRNCEQEYANVKSDPAPAIPVTSIPDLTVSYASLYVS
jgi:hypothetical protein